MKINSRHKSGEDVIFLRQLKRQAVILCASVVEMDQDGLSGGGEQKYIRGSIWRRAEVHQRLDVGFLVPIAGEIKVMVRLSAVFNPIACECHGATEKVSARYGREVSCRCHIGVNRRLELGVKGRRLELGNQWLSVVEAASCYFSNRNRRSPIGDGDPGGDRWS